MNSHAIKTIAPHYICLHVLVMLIIKQFLSGCCKHLPDRDYVRRWGGRIFSGDNYEHKSRLTVKSPQTPCQDAPHQRRLRDNYSKAQCSQHQDHCPGVDWHSSFRATVRLMGRLYVVGATRRPVLIFTSTTFSEGGVFYRLQFSVLITDMVLAVSFFEKGETNESNATNP